MKITGMFVTVLFVLLSLPCAYAQDKPATQDKSAAEATAAQPAAPQIPIRVQMVLTDNDGTKKISAMPYTMMLTVSRTGRRDAVGQLRLGVRWPVSIGKGVDGGTQYTYLDSGTNIDCLVEKWNDDRYLLHGTVDLSSVYTMNSANQPTEWKPGDSILGNNPIIRQTRGDFFIALRDGQTDEATVATDPITGHVFKAEVTLTVVK